MSTLSAPLSQWLGALAGETARLSERLRALDGGTDESDSAPCTFAEAVIDDIQAAVEELQVAHEELRVQGAQLAESQGAIEEARRQYQELFEFAPGAYLVTDRQGTIRRANHAVSGMIGFARKYALGKPLVAFVHPDSTELFLKRLREVGRATEDRVHSWEMQMRPRRSGPPADVSVRVAAARDRTGRVTGLRWLLTDITQHKALQARFAVLEEERARDLRARTAELESIVHIQEARIRLEMEGRRASEATLAVLRAAVGRLANEALAARGQIGAEQALSRVAQALLELDRSERPPDRRMGAGDQQRARSVFDADGA